jgi:regulatory protein
MTITQIKELTKSRYLITVDDEFTFVLYKGELRIYKVNLMTEMPEDTFCEIMTVVLPKRAKLRLLNLLQKKSYTEKQLKEKLQEGYYPVDIIKIAIDYVKSFGYINDQQFASDYVEYYKTSKSKNTMKRELSKRGIPNEYMEHLFELANETIDEEEIQIRRWLEKKHYSLENSMKDKKKLYDFLMRKGYSFDKIKQVIKLSDAE